MPTLSTKNLYCYDACGTDGSDASKMKAVYDATCTDTIVYRVGISKAAHDAGVDNDINTAIQDELDAGRY